jgi:hypothetical protein
MGERESVLQKKERHKKLNAQISVLIKTLDKSDFYFISTVKIKVNLFQGRFGADNRRKMSQTGKITIILLLYKILICVQVSALSPSILRGGLVYSEEAGQGPIYLNQDYMSFVRTANTSVLLKSAQITRDFTTLYYTFCGEVDDRLRVSLRQDGRTEDNENAEKAEELEILYSPMKYPIQEASATCKAMGGNLPEIRDKHSIWVLLLVNVSFFNSRNLLVVVHISIRTCGRPDCHKYD